MEPTDQLANRSCPGLPRLAAFTRGKLPASERDGIQSHLASCPACRQALASLRTEGVEPPSRMSGNTSFSGRDTLPPAKAVRPATPAPAAPGQGAAAPGSGPTATFPADGGLPADLAQHPKIEVLELLGRGGMGAVYKARHKVMDRLVALKVIHAALVGNANAVERFHREVQAAARLHHPNIVTAFDADRAGTTHFLVMEFIEGIDLARLVDTRGPLPVAHACHFVRQAALGLQHAHDHGMVHRDIKPHNLMLAAGGVVKVMDFGLARLQREGTSDVGLTSEHVLMGTADYIAPEQAQDAHKADIRADIYSLGCTLFHLLAGQPPFAGGNAVQKIAAHLTATVPLAELPASTPADLRAVLAKMVDRDPARRYQLPGEVARVLLPIVQKARGPQAEPARTEVGAHAAEADTNPWADATALPARPSGKPRPLPRRGRGWLIGTAVLVLGLIPVGVFLLVTRREAGVPAANDLSKSTSKPLPKAKLEGTAATTKEAEWLSLTEGGLAEWRQDGDDWRVVGGVELDPRDHTRFVVRSGAGILYSAANGKGARNLVSRREFGDVELEAEFVVPFKGNSGVFFLAHYELQVWDSWGVSQTRITDCGGLFPCRVDGRPIAGHGCPPRENASRRPGEWQRFDATFRAPRFDPTGRLLSPARFIRVVHNGRLIHEDAEVTSSDPRSAPAPLFLQGGFGAIAFRTVRVRPLVDGNAK